MSFLQMNQKTLHLVFRKLTKTLPITTRFVNKFGGILVAHQFRRSMLNFFGISNIFRVVFDWFYRLWVLQ
jgi:hypothetical protein